MFKKTILTLTILFSMQSIFSTFDYSARNSLTTNQLEADFLNTCLHLNSKELNTYLNGVKQLHSPEEFKQLINMTTKFKSSLLKAMIQPALDAGSEDLEKLKNIASFNPDPQIGNPPPLFTLLQYYTRHAIAKTGQENCMTILKILNNLHQDFNVISGYRTPLDYIIEHYMKDQFPIENTLTLTEELLKYGADPTIRTRFWEPSSFDTVFQNTTPEDLEESYPFPANNSHQSKWDKMYELFKKYGFHASLKSHIKYHCTIL